MRITNFIVFAFGVFCHLSGAMAGVIIPEPKDLDDYVGKSDLIVLGNFVGVDNVRNFYGYQSNAGEREAYERKLIAAGHNLPFSMGIPIIDYRFNVVKIIKPAKGGVVPNSKILIYRKFVGGQYIASAANERNPLDSYVLFLKINPDGKSYGVMWSSSEVFLDDKMDNPSYKITNGSARFLNGKYAGQNFVDRVSESVLNLNASMR